MFLPHPVRLIQLIGLALMLLSDALNAEESFDAVPIEGEVAIVFEAQSGETAEGFRGEFEVPTNWQHPTGDTLTLSYVRFPRIGDGSGTPIVYLAGGPGGSGSATARSRRFPLFMAMREFGDVIAFDQRGTGDSSRPPTCTSSQRVDDMRRYSDLEFVEVHRRAAEECVARWANQGVRSQDWTTRQSVGDLEALRRHLGADKISLWGISYGSHLALAAIKAMDDRIERVVLASVEGLDQTVKRPAETIAYFERLQAAIDARPDLKARYPDVVGLIQNVHRSLDAEPITIEMSTSDVASWTLLLESRDMQRIASMMIADPGMALQMVDLYGAVSAGITAPVAGLLSRFRTQNEFIEYAAMPFFMDIASGIGAEALQQFEAESKSSPIGTMLNFPMPHLHDAVPGLDLGAEFREGPRSETPVLVLTGTLDGRTYPDSQRAAVAGLANAEITIVENAGHNLFMTSPAVTERIQAFMRGEEGASRITIEGWGR